MTKRQKLETGQSLLEVIIALAIAGLVALGLVRVTGSAVKNSRFSADQSQLTALAQRKISQIIDYKNNNYQIFWGTSYPSVPPGIPSEDFTDESKNYCLRTAVVDNSAGMTGNAKMAKITVDVYFDKKVESPQCDAGSYSHTLHFETNVTN